MGYMDGSLWPTENVPTPSTPSSDDIISRLMANMKQNPAADVASILGGYSQGEKANRVVEGNFTGDYDRMMLDREAAMNKLMLQAQSDRNANEADAFDKVNRAAYIKAGGFQPSTSNLSLGGKSYNLPTFMAPRAASPEQVNAAATLQDTVMSRLGEQGSYQPSFSYQPHPLESYAKPGLMEKITSGGAAGIGIVDRLLQMFGGGGGNSDPNLGNAGGLGGILSTLGGKGGNTNPVPGGISSAGSGIGSALAKYGIPAAGAAAGIYGLAKNKGPLSNIASGAGAGASIGSMVPGLGTAVGAGIGAGVGALRGLFGGGPSEAEKMGRVVAGQARSTISSGATPEQHQEALNSGWDKPEDALTLIVMRDELAKHDGNPSEANQLMEALYKAEKGGPDAVQGVIQTIMAKLGGGTQMGEQPGNMMRAPGGMAPSFNPGPGQYRG